MGAVEEDGREWRTDAKGRRGVEFEAVGFKQSPVNPADTNDGLRYDSSLCERCPCCHACDAEGTTNPPWDGILFKRAAPCGLLGLIGTA